MHILSVFFSMLNFISSSNDTSFVKFHIEVEAQGANFISIHPANESLYDTSLFNQLQHIKFQKAIDIKLPLVESTFISIQINKEIYFPFVVNQNDSISLHAKRDVKDNRPNYKYQLSGSDHLAHEMYRNSFYPPGRNFGFFSDLSKKAKTYSEYYTLSKFFIDSLVNIWDSLRAKNLVTEKTYTLYVADIKGILYNEAIKKMASVKTDTTWQNYRKWLNIRDVMCYQGDAANRILLKTLYGSRLYESYLRNILLEDDAVKDTLLKSSDLGFYYYYDSSIREQAWGEELWILKKLYPNSATKSDIRELDAFRAYYPESYYLKRISQFQDSVLRERKALTEKIDIHDESYQAMSDIFSNLNGRYFFIDVWATWCGPCIQEFSYFTRISNFLFNKKIGEVFFSIDRESDGSKWKKFINDQHIVGSHFLISEKVQIELLALLSKNEPQSALSIPRYLLYDKVLNKYYIDLPRPSSGEVLETFIDDILQKK